MAGLVPAIHVLPPSMSKQTWMPGTRPGMTKRGRSAGSCAMNIQDNSRYYQVYARSLRDPEGFWGEAAAEIDWIEPAKKIFDPAMGLYGRWFAGAVSTPATTRSTAMSRVGAPTRWR